MRTRWFGSWMLLVGLAGWPASAAGQLVEDYHPIKAQCCLAGQAQHLAEELQDWNQLGRYYDENLKLKAQPPERHRVVFFGDSITEFWDLKRDFPDQPYVDRGVSGQTTPQMLARVFPDVIDLHPAVVILLAGTNDIAENTGPVTLAMIEENFQAITELAQKHGIKVILCSVMPVSDYTAHPQTPRHPAKDILALNAWLRSYAEKVHAGFADYYAALVDSQGMLKQGMSNDGLHPNAQGYALVAPVAKAAIERALKK